MLTRIVLPALLGLCVVTTGCQDQPMSVPPDARPVVEGNKLIQYRAPGSGDIYVYNVTDKSLVYSGRVESDDLLVVDPSVDRISVDGQVVSEQDLDQGDQYRISFKRGAEVEREVQIRETRTEKTRVD